MEVQLLIYFVMFILINGMMFASIKYEKQYIKDILYKLMRGCRRAENGTYFFQGIPNDTQKAHSWAESRINNENWIFWNAILNIILQSKYCIFITNIMIYTICFILPKFN